MAEGPASSCSSLIEVLDRILDKGIVVDAWVRISLVGIDLTSLPARIVIASIDTWLKYAADDWRDPGGSGDGEPGEAGAAPVTAARDPRKPSGSGAAEALFESDDTLDAEWSRLVNPWRNDDPAGQVA